MDFLLELRYKSLNRGQQRTGDGMDLSQVTLGAVLPQEEARFRDLMATHHYLGAAPKVGETVWYGALWRGEWVALASFSAAALKCQARDAWIGWTLRHKYDRLHLVANNTRFLLLRPVPNLGSRVLGLCARHLVRDWPARFHHPLVLLEALALDCYSILRNRGRLGKIFQDQALAGTRDFPADAFTSCEMDLRLPRARRVVPSRN